MQLGERTLYPAIVEYLRDIGFSVGSEVRIGSDSIDILFKFERQFYVLEIKISQETPQESKFLQAIVQAYGYARGFKTSNLIVVSYPYDVRGSLVNFDEITNRALERTVQAMILTENWYSLEKNQSLKDILSGLKSRIDKDIQAVYNVEDAAKIIRESIRGLSRLLDKTYRDEQQIADLAQFLSQDYGLFVAQVSDGEKKEQIVRSQTIDLIAYILMNQILFYFVYSRKNKGKKNLEEMKTIKHPHELTVYFEKIREIDFAPIFDIAVASKVPAEEPIVRHINDTIECLLDALRVDRLNHDLYGRLIGKSLPIETRQMLASYYTRIWSARLLANLTISKHSEKVWDAACGSGTLLVAAYERKKFLFQQTNKSLESSEDLAKLHVRFIESEITGTDVMAFACHLASLNLAALNLAVPTNTTRICYMNSLKLDSLPREVEEAYGDIYKELSPVNLAQQTFHSYEAKPKRHFEPKKILLTKVDCVLINPPFTKLNRLPKKVRVELDHSGNRTIVGEGRNPLWVHFLALSDKLLVDGGRLGAIIPLSLLRGKDTKQLREFYFKNYSIEYIVRPAAGEAFSEDSDYSDMILVCRKSKPEPNSRTKIVFFKKMEGEYTAANIEPVITKILTSLDSELETDEISLCEIDQSKLSSSLDNMMPFVFTTDQTIRKSFNKWRSLMSESERMHVLPVTLIQKGYQFRPENTAKFALFIRYLSDARITRAYQYFDHDQDFSDKLVFKTKDDKKLSEISLDKLSKTFRTVTSVKRLNFTGFHDYVLKSEAKSNSRGSHLFLAHRFRPNSQETFATAFYSSMPLVSTEKVTMFYCPDEDCKMLCLYFNSIFYLLQVMMLSSQATYGFLEMTRLDFSRVLVPKLSRINDAERQEILKLFTDVQNRDLSSLRDQFRIAPDYRIAIDTLFSRILQIPLGRKELLELYSHLSEELGKMGSNDQLDS